MPHMYDTNHASRARALVAVIVVASIWSCGKPDAAGGKPDSAAAKAATTAGFVERAEAAGIAFRMNNLTREQGERFRVNLYDHGAGLAIGDYDGDGRDDVYFLNQHGTNALYRNAGDGSFVDVSARAGVALGDRVSVGATFADYDDDGHADLFVTSTRGGNVLFHNRGDGTFEDVTAASGVRHVGHSQTPVFFDYDGDGDLDLFLTNTARWTTDTIDSTSGAYEGKASLPALMGSPTEHNILYRNDGRGMFTDVTRAAGLQGEGWAGDVALFDYDEDGFLDLFVPSMFGRGQLYRNDGHGRFTDVTASTLEKTPHGAIGTKVFDFDGDGRLDIVVNNFNDRPYLFANRFPKRNWIELRLTGTRSNRDAIGAVARLFAGSRVMVRQVNPAGGYLAQSSKVLHFGLGDRSAVDSIVIRWPRGTMQTVKSPAIDALLQLREPTG
jgi:hypothetical protein